MNGNGDLVFADGKGVFGVRFGVNGEKSCDSMTGVGSYTLNLMRALVGLKSDDKLFLYFFHENPWFDLWRKATERGVVIRSAGVRSRRNRRRILWEQFLLPTLAKADHLDVLHYVDHTLSFVERPAPIVLTVHDLGFYRMPSTYPLPRRLYKQAVAGPSLRRATRVIAISEHTKQEIMELAGLAENRIDVIPYGLNPIFRPIDNEMELDRFRKAHGLPERFILYVGSFQPRKNLDTLVAAYARLPRHLDAALVLCGEKDRSFRRVAQKIAELGPASRVRILDPFANESLPPLYNLATVFVYPSLYEGFGLPPLEAMGCGAATIVSDAASLPEVVGEGAMKTPPLDVERLAFCMQTLLEDESKRLELARAGLERARSFSWEKAAESTMACYRKAMGKEAAG